MLGLIFYCLAIVNYSSAVNVECNFILTGSIYKCQVTNILNIKSPADAFITGVSGNHSSDKTNDDVTIFIALSSGIQYFPKKLEQFFKNLDAIIIDDGPLKQISQSDLKPFPNLDYLELAVNNIEILEDDLFINHPNITVVWFGDNKIFHVGKNVFNNMNKLIYLGFGNNQCINLNTWNNSTGVNIIIESLKTKCFDEIFDNFSQNLSNLENKSKTLTFQTFPIWRQNLENLEMEFKASRFSYLLSIKSRFEVLNAISIEDFTTTTPVTTSTSSQPSSTTSTSLTTTEVGVTSTSEQPDDCMSSNFENLENNLTEMFTDALDQTEQNLKSSFADSCINVNYQTLNLMQSEFSKVNEKLVEHSSEVRTGLIKGDGQRSAILSDISSLKSEMEDIKEKLAEILDAVNRGS